jgi:hypothetical protein
MATTQLNPSGLPGKPYTFSPAPQTTSKSYTARANILSPQKSYSARASIAPQVITDPYTARASLIGATAVCVNIVYLTPTTGFIWYVESNGDFGDGNTIEGGGNTIEADGVQSNDSTFYPQGELKVTSGNNNGERRQIIKDIADETTLQWPLPNALEVGDTYIIYPGCDKTAEGACQKKYNNDDNFRGFLYVPKVEESIT